MNFRIFVLVSLLALVTQPAFAQRKAPASKSTSEKTEYFYQPSSGQNAIQLSLTYTPAFSYATYSRSTGAKVADVKQTAQTYMLEYGRGINDALSVGAAVGYGEDKTLSTISPTSSVEAKANGMTDIQANARYRLALPTATLYFTGEASMSPGKAKNPSLLAEGTKYTGGWTLSPQVGAVFKVSAKTKLGTELAYTYKGERTVGNNSSTAPVDLKYTGGSILALTGFVEQEVGAGLIDFSLGLTSTESTETDTSGTKSYADAYTSMLVGLSGKMPVSATVSGLGGIAYVSTPERASSSTLKLPSYSAVSIMLGGRAEF